jgi:hypothetical protein
MLGAVSIVLIVFLKFPLLPLIFNTSIRISHWPACLTPSGISFQCRSPTFLCLRGLGLAQLRRAHTAPLCLKARGFASPQARRFCRTLDTEWSCGCVIRLLACSGMTSHWMWLKSWLGMQGNVAVLCVKRVCSLEGLQRVFKLFVLCTQGAGQRPTHPI